MNYSIEKLDKFILIGFEKEIPLKKGSEFCPKFWDEFKDRYLSKIDDGSEVSKAIIDNNIGEFALCLDEVINGNFRYVIGGIYQGGKVPQGMVLIPLEEGIWGKYKCIGKFKEEFQKLNNKIFNENVVDFKGYELRGNYNLEWYSDGDMDSDDYESGIWLPLKMK